MASVYRFIKATFVDGASAFWKHLPPLLITHAVHMKEYYENMQVLLESIHYNKYSWNICGDLKVIARLLGNSARLYGI